jgi:UDP-2,4-diacetamido-2,4,6-trideoxy-beta-L-altropyranose hydrolase
VPEPLVVVFRTDAALHIGNGHLMRCLTLADALRDSGNNCHFVCRQQPGQLLDHVTQRGHQVHVLETTRQDACDDGAPVLAHAHWLGCSQHTDALQTMQIVGSLQPSLVVVDHYALDVRWERQLRSLTRHLMVIDDLADRVHDCDLLLDQNPGRQSADYAGLVPSHCRILLGPGYALLRPEFAALRKQSLARREHPALRQLLITMGGVDQDNATCRILEALQLCTLPPECRIVVVMGAHAPWLEQVRAAAAKLRWQVEIKVDVTDMAVLMLNSDLALGAAGSTSWERCCLGLPGLLLVLAANQRAVAGYLAAEQAAVVLELDANLDQQLQTTLPLVAAPEQLRLLSQRVSAITDGTGCQRVLQQLELQME